MTSHCVIKRYNKTNFPTYQEFFKDHLCTLTPALFSSDLTSEWKAFDDWLTRDRTSVNWNYFETTFGGIDVPVTAPKDHKDTSCTNIKFQEYIDWARTIEEMDATLLDTVPPRYLKDWHYTRSFRTENVAGDIGYHTPVYFQDDWLNHYYDHIDVEDDYKFVYIGGPGTETEHHFDVFRSHSWSTNILGQKKWKLYYPQASSEEVVEGKYVEIIQNQGETLFVPSGWAHSVKNMTCTECRFVVSINHNWFQASNLRMVWNHFHTTMKQIEYAIRDCKELMTVKEWSDQCQLILRTESGMNLTEFINLLLLLHQDITHGKYKLEEILVDDSISLSQYSRAQIVQTIVQILDYADQFADRQHHTDVDWALLANDVLVQMKAAVT